MALSFETNLSAPTQAEFLALNCILEQPQSAAMFLKCSHWKKESRVNLSAYRMDWRDFIERYDRSETLFYIDQPYSGNEKEYGADVFARSDFKEMAERLSSIKARLK